MAFWLASLASVVVVCVLTIIERLEQRGGRLPARDRPSVALFVASPAIAMLVALAYRGAGARLSPVLALIVGASIPLVLRLVAGLNPFRGHAGGAPTRSRLPHDSPARVAAAVGTIVVLAIGWLCWAAYEVMRSPVARSINPALSPFYGTEQANAYLSGVVPFFDARGQSLAHLAMLAVTAVMVLALLSVPRLRRGSRGAVCRVLLLAGCSGFVVLAVWSAREPTVPKVVGVLAAGGVFAGAGWLRRPGVERALRGATIVLVALALVPGLFAVRDLSTTPWTYVQYQGMHYAAVLGPSDLLAAGYRLFEDVTPGYGLLPAVVTAALERFFRPLSLGDYALLLRGAAALYLLMAGVVLHRYARRRWLLTLTGLLLLIPWDHFNQNSLRYPNLSPWRTIGVPIAILIVFALGRARLRIAAFVLGLMGAVSLLLSLDSGGALAVGFVAYLCFRYDLVARPLQFAQAVAISALGALVGFTGFVVLVRCLLGSWVTGGWRALGAVLFFPASSFSGRPATADVWAILIFAHATFVLLHLAFTAAAQDRFRAGFRAFVASTLLVWFAYYANRPHPLDLPCYYVLYAFLLVDLIRHLVARLARRTDRSPLVLASALAVTLVVAPSISEMDFGAARELADGLRPLWSGPPADALLVSGVWLPRQGAAELQEKADLVRSRPANEAATYLGPDAYLMAKVSGVIPAIPALDVFFSSLTKAHFQRMIDGVVGSRAAVVYLDAPGTVARDAFGFDGFFDLVRRGISSDFERTGVEHGLEIWTRIPADPFASEEPQRSRPLVVRGSTRIVCLGGGRGPGGTGNAGVSWTDGVRRRLGTSRPAVRFDSAGLGYADLAAEFAFFERRVLPLKPDVSMFVLGVNDAGVTLGATWRQPFNLVRLHRWKARRHACSASEMPDELVRSRQQELPRYRLQLRRLAHACRAAGIAPVFVTQPSLIGCSVDPRTGVSLSTVKVASEPRVFGYLAADVLQLFNEATLEIGAQEGVFVIDLAGRLRRDSSLFSDFVHLSGAGADEAARIVVADLRELLARRDALRRAAEEATPEKRKSRVRGRT